jgi:hypothetical protein
MPKGYDKGAKYLVSDAGYEAEVYLPQLYCVLRE